MKPVLKVLVTVSGGVVQAVHVFDPKEQHEIDVVVHDYDVLDGPDYCEARTEEELDQETWFSDGQTVAKFLEQVQLQNPCYKEVV